MAEFKNNIQRRLPILLLISICILGACTHPVRRLVFQPHKIESIPAFPEGATDLKRFWLKTEQGDVEGWLLEGNGDDPAHPGPAVLMAHGAPDILLSDNYDTLSALSDYEGPILIIHGTRDDVVPVRHALEMKKQIPEAQLILYECGHSDGPPVWETYWKDIAEFLERINDDL